MQVNKGSAQELAIAFTSHKFNILAFGLFSRNIWLPAGLHPTQQDGEEHLQPSHPAPIYSWLFTCHSCMPSPSHLTHGALCEAHMGNGVRDPLTTLLTPISLFIQISNLSLDCGRQARMLCDILISEIFLLELETEPWTSGKHAATCLSPNHYK